MKRFAWMTAALVVGMMVLPGMAMAAGDPVKVGPHIYKMVYENDKVRVSEITFKVGDQIAMHSHPDHFVYVLAAGTIRLSNPDGKTSDFAGTPGQVVWIPAESHAAENVGTTEFKALVVELKPLPAYE